MGRTVIALTALVLLITISSGAEGASYTVDGELKETHTLRTDSDDNRYFITIDSDGNIRFDLEVFTGGKFKVYLIQGHYTGYGIFSYYEYYSSDSPRTSFDRSFHNEEGEGNDFTILVTTDDDDGQGVTYHINIDTEEAPFWEMFETVFICCGIPIIAAIAISIYKGRDRRSSSSPDKQLVRDMERARRARIRTSREHFSTSSSGVPPDQLMPGSAFTPDRPPPPSSPSGEVNWEKVMESTMPAGPSRDDGSQGPVRKVRQPKQTTTSTSPVGHPPTPQVDLPATSPTPPTTTSSTTPTTTSSTTSKPTSRKIRRVKQPVMKPKNGST